MDRYAHLWMRSCHKHLFVVACACTALSPAPTPLGDTDVAERYQGVKCWFSVRGHNRYTTFVCIHHLGDRDGSFLFGGIIRILVLLAAQFFCYLHTRGADGRNLASPYPAYKQKRPRE
jgi:hypothetical protein